MRLIWIAILLTGCGNLTGQEESPGFKGSGDRNSGGQHDSSANNPFAVDAGPGYGQQDDQGFGYANGGDVDGGDIGGGGGETSTTTASLGLIGFCSDNGTEGAGGVNLQNLTGVNVALLDQAGQMVHQVSSQVEQQQVRAELVNSLSMTFAVPSAVPDGRYYAVLCSPSNPGACTPSTGFMNNVMGDINDLEDTSGTLGVGLVEKLGDQITQIGRGTGNSEAGGGFLLGLGESSSNCLVNNSPLMIPIYAEKIELSAPLDGRRFNIDRDEDLELISWPVGGSASFLALDRNNNGQIDDINELFGNNTLGEDGTYASNGFTALAKYDTNGDNTINADDPIYSELRLFTDFNENGHADEGEWESLADVGLTSIDLNYTNDESWTWQQDKYFNETRQRSTASFLDSGSRLILDIWFRTLD